jgi:ADP-heptose:LPS heptosyltransferase
LGDFIFILPALTALRKAYPTAQIVLLGRDWHAAFLQKRPGPVDRIITVPHGGVGDESNPAITPQQREEFIQTLVAEYFDLAIQLHGGGRHSNPFIRRLGARYTVGLKTPDAPPLDKWVPYVYFQSEILRYLEVVGLVGAVTTDHKPRLAVTPADLEEAYQVVPQTQQPLVVLHPGASDPKRRWPLQNFRQLGVRLADEGLKIVVSGSAAEEWLAAKLVTTIGRAALNVAGRLSLAGLAGLLSRCVLVVSNDTGPLHLAGAVGSENVNSAV